MVKFSLLRLFPVICTIMKALVCSVTMVGCESWTIKKDDEAKLNACIWNEVSKSDPLGIMDCKEEKWVGVGDCWSRKESVWIDQTGSFHISGVCCGRVKIAWRRRLSWIKSSSMEDLNWSHKIMDWIVLWQLNDIEWDNRQKQILFEVLGSRTVET